MEHYEVDDSNARGDIVIMPISIFKDEDMTITIPNNTMAKITNANAAFYSAKVALPIIAVAGLISSAVLESGVILAVSLVLLVLSIFFIVAVASPMQIASIGAKTIKVSPKYFSAWYFSHRPSTYVWKEEHQKEFLEMLDNDFVRDDFIRLLEAVENKNISPEKSKEIYNHMKKVGLTDKKIIEKSMDNMLDKYKTHAEIIREIENI